jgi:hypothetical protein
MSTETQQHQYDIGVENERQQWQRQLDEQVAIYGSPCCRGAYIAGRIDGLQERMHKHNAELDRMMGNESKQMDSGTEEVKGEVPANGDREMRKVRRDVRSRIRPSVKASIYND